MDKSELLCRLMLMPNALQVIENTEFHISVVVPGGKHEVWVRKTGEMKCQPYGKGKSITVVSIDDLVTVLS